MAWAEQTWRKIVGQPQTEAILQTKIGDVTTPTNLESCHGVGKVHREGVLPNPPKLEDSPLLQLKQQITSYFVAEASFLKSSEEAYHFIRGNELEVFHRGFCYSASKVQTVCL